MPSLPNQGSSGNTEGDNIEIMKNVAYLIKNSGMGYREVIELPYQVFLSLLKQFMIFELESSEEGREYLQQCKILNTKDADLTRIRKLKNKLEN